MRYTNLSGHARRELLARLEQMPDFLAKSFADLPRSLHATPGPAGGFSPVEQAWHLADLEAIAFAERIRRLRAEMNPRLPDFAGNDVARERNYRALSLREGIVAFRKAREQTLSELRRIRRQE